jgi:hypothetical protein
VFDLFLYNFETLLGVQTVVYRIRYCNELFRDLTIKPVSILTRPVPMTPTNDGESQSRHSPQTDRDLKMRSAKTSLLSGDHSVSIWGSDYLFWDWPPVVFHPCDRLTGWTTDYIVAPRRVLPTAIDPWVMPSGQRNLTLFLVQSGAYADYGVHHRLVLYLAAQVVGCHGGLRVCDD